MAAHFSIGILAHFSISIYNLADNIAALELVFMRPEFCLTEQGRKVLNGYSGFGGLKCILNPAEKDTDIEK